MAEKLTKRGRPPRDSYGEDAEAIRRIHELRKNNKDLSITGAVKAIVLEMKVRGTDPVDRLRKKYRDFLKQKAKSAAEKRAAERAAEEFRPTLSSEVQSAAEAARYARSPEFKETLAQRKRLLRDPAHKRALTDIQRMRESGLLRDAVARARSIRRPK